MTSTRSGRRAGRASRQAASQRWLLLDGEMVGPRSKAETGAKSPKQQKKARAASDPARGARQKPKRSLQNPTSKRTATSAATVEPALTAAQRASASAKRAAERGRGTRPAPSPRTTPKAQTTRATPINRRRSHADIEVGDLVAVDFGGRTRDATVISFTPTHAELWWFRGTKVKHAQLQRTQILRVVQHDGGSPMPSRPAKSASRGRKPDPIRPLSQPDTRTATFVPPKAPTSIPAEGFQCGTGVMLVIGGLTRIGTVQRVITPEQVVVTYPTASGPKTSTVMCRRLRACRA